MLPILFTRHSVDAGVEKIDIGFDSNELAAKIAKNFQELGT